MPASKRDLSPPESESKIRKLDEDGDAMPSKVATILNTGNSPERTAAPRTKKKLSPSPGGNNSRPCSPLSDSSESVSDPPFKKAKLLSTSAFSTVSSEESKSNTSLTQTTLTESDEASIGSSNTDFIRGRDGNDKAPCVIQYSNKVKAEELPCSPSDPVQIDHSYGRVSEITETDQDVKILQAVTSLVPESQRPTESIDASTGNLTECEAKPSNFVRMHVLESQKTDNIIIDSCSDFLDNGTSIGASEEEKEETSSEPQCGNKRLLFSEKASVEIVEPDETERPDTLTVIHAEGLIQGPTVLVRENFDQDVKFHTEETYHETLVEETGTDFTISHPLLTKNSEQILAASSRPERHSDDGVSTVQCVTNLQQTDNTVQFTFEESAELEKMQDQVSNAFTNTSGHINEITEKLHKNEAEQKMEMVTSSNECCSQNIMSNKKAINKDQEGHDDYRVNDSTPGVISLLETEIPCIEDAVILNGQLSVEIPTEFSEGITYAAVEMPHSETQTILRRQTESSSTSSNKTVKSDCFHEATEPVSDIPQNVSEDLTLQNYEMTAVSPALQESLCSVTTVDVQAEIQLNTSNQYFKEPEVKTCELHKDFVQHQIKINHPESSEIIHQEIVMAVNLEDSVISEQSTHVSSQIEDELITAESKDEVGGNYGASAIVPVSPTVPTDVQDEIQRNTSDQYFKEPEGETFELQEESLKHQSKTTNYPESSEIIHQEIAVNMENSVISEQSTHVSSKIENETITTGSKVEVEGNHDGSAVPVSPTGPTVDVQCEIQLNTSDQYFKEPEGETFELQEESLKHQTKTIVISEQSTRVSSKIENETITAEFKDDAEGSPDASAVVPISSTVDVQGEIQLNTSDQYFKEPEVENFELQEESLKHQTKTINYPESSEVIHPEIVVAIDMKNSVASEQSTHVLSKIENKTVTAESKDEIESNHDGSAVVPVSPPDLEMMSPPESALSPKTCSQYQEVSETAELSEVDQVDCSTATEDDNEGHVESLIIHTDMQSNVLPHIFSASTDEINSPSVEMCLDVSEASNETQTVMVHNLQNIGSREMVVSEDQINISSEEMPISSTVPAFESLTRQAEDVQESFISNAFTEHSEDDVAEYYTTNVQAIAMSEEISIPTSTVVLDTNNGQEVSIPDSDIDNANNDNAKELHTDCADTIPMDLQLSEQNTVEEKISVQEVMTEHVDGQTITIPEEGEVAPSVVVAEEAVHSITFFSEVQRYRSHSENIEGEQMQTEPIVVDTPEDYAVISESQEIEGATNFIETNEGAVDARDLTSETKQVLLNNEEHDVQSNEETIIVAFQQEDVHRVEETNTIGTDFKKHENEIVYEPISSPESTTDGEVPALPENNDTVRLMHTDILNTSQILYSVSALSDKEMVVSDGYRIAEIACVPPESSAVISPIEEFEVHGKSFQNNKSISGHCVLDNQTEFQSSQTDILSSVSQNEEISKMNNQELKNEEYSDNQVMSAAHPAAEMQSTEQSTACEQLEQSNGTEDMKVLVTSANEDAPDGQLENTEDKSEESVITQSVFTEQVQELTGPGAVVGADATAVTFTTENQENQEADSTCEEYVILEPVPVSAIHYDIITQAVAESGLSEEINANSESILGEVQQTSVPKEDGTEEITQETMLVDKTLENSEQVEEICVSTQSTEMMEVTPANCGPDVTQPVDVNMEPPECQILEDIEIGREIVVAEEEQEEDSDISIIEKPQEYISEETKKLITDETNDDTGNETSKETVSLDTVKKDSTTADNKEPEKPKKQEMNTQARTKARLAALAEQKAAASKRQSRREQLNLLALCQEIAEDIATDSMLLKKIEEEKQAAAAAAAKSEVNKNESQPVNCQEEHPEDAAAPTPERAEASSSSLTPAEDSTVNQPSTPNADEPKAAAEPPKRRFFTSQVSVPLKVHEKKKLTRYQRLRQVELQREKMSWARVKKLKSDQANQMFSEMDWQASMSFSSFAKDHVATAPQPVASLSKPPSPGLSSANTPAPNAEEPKVEVSKPEAPVGEPANVVTPQTGPSKAAREKKPEADKTQKENSKAEPTKPELRKSSRISKIESSKAATPATATKGKATSKKVLPAVPPPMPNGLNNQSLKIEYKPYKPRPKYSPDDFELDDDPFPSPKACPQAMSTHQTRPNVHGRPASQTTTPSKTTVSTQPSNQLKSNVLTPAGQISGQTKPASSSPANPPAAQTLSKGTYATPSSSSSSKILPTTEVLQKTPVSSSPQSKVAIAPTESKPAAASLPQVKLTSTISQKDTTSSVNQPAPSKTTPASPPDDTPGPAKCKATEDAPVASVLPKEDSNISNDTQKSDENKKATPVHPVNKTATGVHPETKTELEETDLNKASKLCQDQNVETPMSDTSLHKEIKKLKEADKDCTQTIIDAGQKHFGPVACSVCGMLYTAANPEDESQHLLFHNQFISAVKYVGWKKERILSEFPDGKIILVLPDDPKYALKKIEEIREMVDNDLGFQQVESKCPSKTKTFLFISNDKKVAGCLIAEHINEGYRVIEELVPSGSEGEKVMFERQRAWCCSTTAEPAICGISRIWVVNTMRRQGIASRMLDCLRNNFIYGSNLSKDEIAFSDPTPDGKLFATHYFGTSQFLVYNFVNGTPTSQAKTEKV